MSKNLPPRHCFSWKHKRSVPANKGSKTERERSMRWRDRNPTGERGRGNPQGGVAQSLGINFTAG